MTMTTQDIEWSAFYAPLQQFVLRRVHNQPDADDLVQLILERAMSKAQHSQIDNVAQWLFGIARNAVADHYRAHARLLDRAAEELEATPAPGETEAERAEVIACMEPLLNALPEAESQLLRWADMQGRSMQSIADELEISLTAAKSRVQRARQEFIRVTRHCCAITMDARGRVTHLTPHSVRHALECSNGCASAPSRGKKRNTP
jgi:RNA polymerase sigma-70 factor (ECF subfamily)